MGVDVQVQHRSATPPGQTVTATATITAVEKNVVTFDVEAHDPVETIGSGTHRRAIVKTAKLAQRVSEKQPGQTVQTSNQASLVPGTSKDLPSLQNFLLERSENVLLVQLNRPEKKNAINRSMTLELHSIINWLEQTSDIQAVIFQGAGQVFSAGDDISELQPDDPERMSELSLLRGATYLQLANLKQVTIAAVDGFALGGGFVFAAACDFRIATHRAQFGLPEARMGWPPNYGTEIIQALLGRSQAIQLSVQAEPITSRRAYELGWVQQVVPLDQLKPAAQQIAEQVLQNAPLATGAIKKIMKLGPTGVGAVDQDQVATAEFLECLKSQFARDSINSFR